eukprot:CAMPEP_0172489088 /NCGR_PEP_ID=MMETSP1066-20121228/18890_1 /TAXON_ID=671091 /ORGANISM="Coscinodiscus wailesii, Strain CCMP2513" /LENGTH=432 /DNA_ID=CAMNT_0013256717 /DNA_START=138 /DNA_END=1436 /DNA_ORIENTATION=-
MKSYRRVLLSLIVSTLGTASNIFMGNNIPEDNYRNDGTDVVNMVLYAASNTAWSQSLQYVMNMANGTTTDTAEEKECFSQLENWFDEKLAEVNETIVSYGDTDKKNQIFDNLDWAANLVAVHKLYFDLNATDEYFGYDGSHTAELKLRHKNSEKFWNRTDPNGFLDLHDVNLLAMHGSDLQDDSVMILLFKEIYYSMTGVWLENSQAKQNLDLIRNDIQTYFPGGFQNPLLTANAFASGSWTGPHDVIIIGDGILQFIDDLNLTRDGSDFIHAHEYGHQLQFVTSTGFDVDYDNYTSIEETRRAELMADAYGTYYLAHNDGGDMAPEHIMELHGVAFAAGGCPIFDDDWLGGITDHGTPEQRACAARWGASVAVASKTDIMNPESFADLFDLTLPHILDLDERTCQLVLWNSTHENNGNSTDNINGGKRYLR